MTRRYDMKHISNSTNTIRYNLLPVPQIRKCFGSRSFSVAALTIWNSLHIDVRNSCSIASFCRHLKTVRFSTFSSLMPRLTRAP